MLRGCSARSAAAVSAGRPVGATSSTGLLVFAPTAPPASASVKPPPVAIKTWGTGAVNEVRATLAAVS
jgi:hypothetical protein